MQWNEFQSHIRHFSYQDQERLKEAFCLGEKAHKGQVRFSGEPYFNHPIAVAKKLAEMGADADTLIAALLHDTVEDTSLTLQKIDEQFDGKVASLIDGVTKLYAEDLKDRKEARTLDEKIETLRKMFTFLEKDVRIMVIKLADRLHNMQTIEFFPEEKQQTYAQDTLDIYVKIAERLSMLDMREELEYLCLKVLEPQLLKKLIKLREKHEQQGEKVVSMLQKKIYGFVRNPPFDIQFSQKPWHKLRIQLAAGRDPVTGISDLGVTVICKDSNACYQALGILHQLWHREQLSFQDFINSPMVNGYQGLHTTIILENGMRIRCKIRSKEMQEYAKRGITTKCFDSEAAGLLEYLPWTKHISTLSEDTTDRSQEFWESLQSDILGESITVHSSDSQTVMLPEGSTALDGAFYCYGAKALSLKSITMNGKEVSPYVTLTNGASISIDIDKKKTVSHEWLQYVHTGLATAAIRSGLANQNRDKRLQTGKQLLRMVMHEHKQGFIEEFNQKKLEAKLKNIGLDSMEEMYLAVSEGRVRASEVYEAIFGSHKNTDKEQRSPCTLQYSFPLYETDMINKVIAILEQYSQLHRRIQFDYSNKKSGGMVKIKLMASPDEKAAFCADMAAAGAKDISAQSDVNLVQYSVSLIFLICLWGLDPVFAYKLIHTFDLRAIDMTLVRFWTLTVVSGMMLSWRIFKVKISEVIVPLKHPALWASVFFLVLTAFTTYTALQNTYPSHYTIPMTITGLLLTTIMRKSGYKTMILSWLLLLSGLAILLLFTSWGMEGIFFTLLAVSSFTAFSFISKQYKQRGFIEARSEQFFFILSALCALTSLPLLLFSTVSSIPMHALAWLILFCIFFAGLPYYIYYFVMSYKQFGFMLRYSFLLIFATLGGQAIIIGHISPSILLASALVITGAFLSTVFHRRGTGTAVE